MAEELKVDVALLQQPLQVSMKGVQMIVKCMENGTPEMKNLLLQECDVIFECKVCRSLFRGLPNLLSHKRSFCIKQYVDKRTDFPRENPQDTCYVKPSEPDPQYADSEDEVSVAEVRARRGRIRDPILLSLSRNLLEPEDPPPGPIPVNRITDPLPPNVKISSVSPQKLQQLSTSRLSVELSPLSLKNNSATLKLLTSPSVGSIGNVGNLTSRLNQSSTPAEKFPGSLEDAPSEASSSSPDKTHNTKREQLQLMKNVDIARNRCLQCRKSFLQWQYLLSHMRNKHADERKLYKCIYCETVFQYPKSIGRHLVRRHKKNPREIADVVKRIREQPIMVKTENSVTKGSDKPKGKANNDASMFKTKFSLITCRLCNKVFGKKSTRDNHEKVCLKRISQDTNPGEPGVKRGRGRPRKSPPAILKPNGEKVVISAVKPVASTDKVTVNAVAKPNRRKAGRPCKVEQNHEEDSDSDDEREDSEVEIPKQNGHDSGIPAPRRRGRPSVHRQSSDMDEISFKQLVQTVDNKANKGRTMTKSQSPVPKIVTPQKKDPATSPVKVKRTGYTERFEDMALPYMDTKCLKCLICSQFFLLKPTLITHVCSIHLKMKRFKCTLCDWKGLFKSEVVIHLQHKHGRDLGTKVKEKLVNYVVPL